MQLEVTFRFKLSSLGDRLKYKRNCEGSIICKQIGYRHKEGETNNVKIKLTVLSKNTGRY